METFQCIQHLFFVLPYAEHDTSFCNTDAFLLRLLEDLEALPERGSSISNEWRKSFYSLDVVRVDIKARLGNQ